MKLKHILPALGLLLASSCADELPFGGELRPGEEVDLTIGVELPVAPEVNVMSRAGAELQPQIYDFYLFIFDPETGALRDKYYFPTLTKGAVNACAAEYSSNGLATITAADEKCTTATLNGVHTKAGQARVVGVANVAHKGASMILSNVAKATTFDELQRVLTTETEITASIYVCAGYYANPGQQATDGIVNITNKVLPGSVVLESAESRVNFEITSDTEHGVNFSLESYELQYIPANSPLFHIDGVNGTEYMEARTINAEGNSFSFFTLENSFVQTDDAKIINGPKRYEVAESEWRKYYGARAAWEGDVNNRTYLHAPEKATRVILRGHYEDAIYKGSVTYTIFLGEKSAMENVDDYTVRRNVDYTYKIQINGVSDITTWIRTQEINDRPDSEGHLSYGDGSVKRIDCHYCQDVIEVKRGKLKDMIAVGGLNVSGKVPVAEKYFEEDFTYDGTPIDDATRKRWEAMSWVQASVMDGTEPGGYLSYTIAHQRKYKNGDQTSLMSPLELMEDMYDFAMGGTDREETRKYTIFFDEYVYPDLDWTKLVDQPDRTFSLLASNFMPSPDKSSSIVEPAHTFDQYPVRTIYNPNCGLKIIWGIESIEEDIRIAQIQGKDSTVNFVRGQCLSFVPSGGGTIYGRQNMWRLLYHSQPNAGELPWSDVINSEGWIIEHPGSTATSAEFVAACMLRNRDNNGNGLIDADELQWYVPSIEQLQELYVAQETLPFDVQLYNSADIDSVKFNGKWKFKHYLASDNKQILWAEEGGSTGPKTEDASFEFYVRCARDMGSTTPINGTLWNIAGTSVSYERPYVYNNPDPGKVHVSGMIDLSRMNSQATRANAELKDVAGVVHTFSSGNKPALKFEYADTLIQANFTADNLIAENGIGETACRKALGPGWRTPSIRELAAMYWAENGEGHDVFINGGYGLLLSRTKYVHFLKQATFPTQTTGRYAHCLQRVSDIRFVLGSCNYSTEPGNHQYETSVIRCVRDYIPGVK